MILTERLASSLSPFYLLQCLPLHRWAPDIRTRSFHLLYFLPVAEVVLAAIPCLFYVAVTNEMCQLLIVLNGFRNHLITFT